MPQKWQKKLEGNIALIEWKIIFDTNLCQPTGGTQVIPYILYTWLRVKNGKGEKRKIDQ